MSLPVRYRWVVYLLGVISWVPLNVWLFGSTGKLQLSVFVPVLMIGIALMAANLASTMAHSGEDDDLKPRDDDRYKFETDRIGFIQGYGSAIVLPAAVAAAFNG